MYEDHYCFEIPKKNSTKIWKYMDCAKFFSLLDKKKIFFSIAANFNDPLEGYPTAADYREFDFSENCKDRDEQNARTMRRLSLRSTLPRYEFCIDCWHINNVESAAMWKLYAGNKGIAIQSTVGRLKGCFNESMERIHIGKVKYIKPNELSKSGENDYYRFLHKRKSFSHEKELRAIVDYRDIVKNEKFNGIYVKVSLDTLIKRIYVYPKSPDWFSQLIKSSLCKCGLGHKEVIKSDLYNDPVY